MRQAVLDAALQRERLAGAPDEYAEAVGAWDAAEGAAAEAAGGGAAGGSAAAKQTMKVVLITGFESFNVDLYKKVGGLGPAVAAAAVAAHRLASAGWQPPGAGTGSNGVVQPRCLAQPGKSPCASRPLPTRCCHLHAGGGGTGAGLPWHLAARLLRSRPGWVPPLPCCGDQLC